MRKSTTGVPSLWQLLGAAQLCVELLAQRSCVIHRQKVTVLGATTQQVLGCPLDMGIPHVIIHFLLGFTNRNDPFSPIKVDLFSLKSC